MSGTTFTWTATTSTAWTVGTNWMPDGPPTAADTAIVPSGTIEINTGTVAITDLSLGGSLSGPTSGEGTLSVVTGGELLVSSAMAVWAGSTLSVDAASVVDIGASGSAPTGSILVETDNSLLGDGLIVGSVINNGTIDATNTGALASSTGGELTIKGTVSGTGTMNIESGATLQLEGPIGAGETINFVGGGAPETLILDQPAGTISTAINGFADGDRIEFSNTDEIIAGPVVTNGNTVTFGVQSTGSVNINYVFTDLNLAAGTPAAFIDGYDPTINDEYFSPIRFFGWTGDTSTNLGVASNWDDFTDGQSPSLVVPGPGDYAEITNPAGGTLSGSLSAEIIAFFNGGSWTLAPGANLVAELTFGVGATGRAESLTVGSESTVSSDGYIDIGDSSGGNGTLTVSGGGVVQDTAPPNPTNYQMYIGTGGPSGTLAASTGIVFVTGADSVVDLGLNGVEIGNNGGSGTVVVSQGGTFIAGTANSNDNDSMAIGRTGNGTVIVTGSGSEVEAIGIAYISHSESGDLTVENSGTFLAAVDPVGLAGLIIGDGSTVGVGGIGMATVTTDGVLASQGYIIVGKAGTQGQLSVSDGGTVEVRTSLVVGDTSVLNGTTTDGNGSVDIGPGGTVDLTYNGTVISTGITTVTGNALIVGENASSVGTVMVNGGGALLTAASAIHIGQSGQGILDVLNNGNVQITSTSVGNLDLGGSGGVPEGGTGTVAVSSGGSIEADLGLYVWAGSKLSADASSGIDLGTSGTYVDGAVNVESGHGLFGNGLVSANVVNNGTIESLGTTVPNTFPAATLEITGGITGTGQIELGANSILRLDSAPAIGQSFSFATGTELILDAPGASFANAITGLNTGDKIEFGNGMTITSASLVNGNTIAVSFHGSGGLSGTYDLTDVAFAAGSGTSFSWNVDGSNGDSFIQVLPPFFNWSGATGDTLYSDPGNWQGDVVPDASDSASFNNNPGTVTGTGTALSLNIGPYGSATNQTWTFAGATITVAGQPSPPFLPYAVGFWANTVLDGGTLNATGGTTAISNVDGPTVTAEGGASVTTIGDSVGQSPGQSGALVLNGAGVNWTEQTVLPAIGGSSGGFFTLGSAGPSGGLAGAAGYLTVENGAVLTTVNAANVGYAQGAYGSATIFAGGVWNVVAGNLDVGASGSGTLGVATGTVAAGGNVQVGLNAGGVGTLTINSGGTVLAGGTFSGVGINSGSVGNLIINAGGVWDATTPQQSNSYVFNIGQAAGSGTLAPATGDVLVTGTGALLNTNGNPLSVGQNGSGTLVVASGGTVATGSANSNTGDNSFTVGRNGTGVVVVTGSGADGASEIIGNGFAAMGRAGTAKVTIENGGSMLIGVDPTDTGGLSIGNGSSGANNGQGGNGEVTVTTDGVLTSDQGIGIGGNGVNGEAYVNTGGTIQVGTSLSVGTATDISGTIYGGSGALSIGAGGTVELTEASQSANYGVIIGNANSSVGGPTDLATGEATVSGPGALLNTNDNPIGVGLLSNGVLTIRQGATVEAGTANSSNTVALSVGRQGDGSVTVDGATLLENGEVYVGRAGTGNLLVENAGSVNVGLDGTGSTTDASLNIGGAGYGGGTLLYVGGAGSMQVTTEATVTSQIGIVVGEDGTNGDLSINSGGVVESSQQIGIGRSTTIVAGDSLISSGGTTVLTAATLEVGNGVVDIGPGGKLAETAMLADNTSGIVIGDGNGATGDVTVHGPGALLSTGGNRLGLGGAGDGSLTVSQGATVLAGTSFADQQAVYIAGTGGPNTTGAITVTDPGSSLTAVGQIDVGDGGTGSLLIENKASVFTGGNTIAPTQGFDVGTDAGAAGAVTVTGNQSLLDNAGQFTVGDGGLGDVSIESGATVTTSPGTVVGLAGAVIANQTGAGGSSVNVTGAGSDWQVNGGLVVGNAGAGALNITAGASVSATTLDAGFGAGSSGIVSVAGDNSSLVTTGTLSLGNAGAGELLVLNGADVTIGGDLDIALAGGSGNIDIDGTGGTLTLGANIVVGPNSAAVLTIGLNTTLTQDNGGVISGQNFTENVYGNVDPQFSSGVVNVENTKTIDYTAYVSNTTFNLLQGVTFTLQTPTIYGTTNLDIGQSAADTSGAELIMNAGSFAAASSVIFNDPLSTLVIGIDQLATIDVPPSGTSGFTPEANPNLGRLLIGEFDGTIKDFQVGDTILVDTYLASASAGTLSQNGSVVSVIEIANSETLGFLKFDTAANATAALDADAIQLVPCFAAGTRIATARGELAVEAVGVGERVRVLLGGGPDGDGFSEVIWVGRREVDCAGHPTPRKVWPVRVAAGAFGPSRPHTDLFLSPDHAVFVGEVLIPVRCLINGSTIAQVPVDRVTYHHIELAEHDVLLAEGLPAESFLDMKDGTNYANRPGPVRLYPDYSARMWEAFGCARLVVTGPELAAARSVVARFAVERKAA